MQKKGFKMGEIEVQNELCDFAARIPGWVLRQCTVMKFSRNIFVYDSSFYHVSLHNSYESVLRLPKLRVLVFESPTIRFQFIARWIELPELEVLKNPRVNFFTRIKEFPCLKIL